MDLSGNRPALLMRLLRGLPALVLLAGCSNAPPADPGTGDILQVFAAASLKESLDEAAAAWAAPGRPRVRLTYAASSSLARQIGRGAPADVFVSADREWMDWLERQGLMDSTSRRDLFGNSLVLVAPAARQLPPVQILPGTDLRPLLGEGRLAVAMVDSVPGGKYARQALRSLDMWDRLAPHVAEGESVRAALMLVARGEAPLGVVYGSDARAEPRARVVATFPSSSHPPIAYPAARVTASTQHSAAEFIGWLASPDAAAIFRRHGFTVH